MERCGWAGTEVCVEHLPTRWGPGNVVMLETRYEGGAELVTGFARRKVRAEEVALEASAAMDAFEASGAPVGEHLADQLLLPMALLKGGHFLTQTPSLHTRTNADVIQGVLPVDIKRQAQADGRVRISVLPRG